MKVTGLGHVLNPTSYHHDAIHYNWPLAEARRIQKRSGSSVAFNKALMKFAERLNRFNIDDDIVKLVKNHTLATRRQMIRITLQALLADGERKLNARRTKTLWLPIPYHGVWKKGGLLGALRTYDEGIRQQNLKSAIKFDFKVRGTWKLKSVPVHRTIVRQ